AAPAAGAVAAVVAFAEAVPALRPQPAQLPLATGVQPLPVLLASCAVLVVALGAGAWSSGSRGAASRPASLREEHAG
ncbi:hypothetical protein, partial [Nocardioides pelophilus]|uniref:hypothetical protein n=1 Tax=Nocardioides pelophilus TaxID=2172019 RepID=UPI00160223EC